MNFELQTQSELFFEAARRKLLADIVSGGWIGKRIGSYRLVAELACGGMGAVYLAERDDGQFNKRVAVKLVRPGFIDGSNLARFRRERQVLANLEHPYIARLIDAGEIEDGGPYMVMEYVEGKPVTEFCAERQAAMAERLNLFRKVCSGVAYAHARCVAHCDLKPANILVTPEGEPKLIDFGIAKLLGSTGANTGLLTPDYASPEQARGEAVTAATDIYSLGVVLHELLTSERPHQRSSCSRQEVKVGKGLDRILLKALAKEPQERYKSVEEFSEDVGRYQVSTSRKTHFRRALALSFVGVLAFTASLHPRKPDAAAMPAAAAQGIERDVRRILYRPSIPGRQWVTEASAEDLRRLIPKLEHAIQKGTKAGVLNENIVTIAHIGAGEPSLVFRKLEPGRDTSSLESRLANAHATLGYARLAGEWDWRGAEREFREALRLDPNLVRALAGYAHLLMKANRRREAALILQRPRGSSPAFTGVTLLEAQLRYSARDYTGVVTDLETLIGQSPGYARAHYLLALSYVHLKQFDRALLELDKAALFPEVYLSNKAWIYGAAGRMDAGGRMLSSCRELGGDCLMGLIGLGRKEEAFAVLRKALVRRAPVLLNLQSDPRFDPIRNDPRFADLVQQVGFDLADSAHR